MNYSICISPACPYCNYVLKSLKKMDIVVNIKNIEKQKNKFCISPIVPALYRGRILIAYGKDIIKYFKP